MLNVEKKHIKTIEDYRHNIKLLKYHLKKEQKTNQHLKYQQAKSKQKSSHPQQQQRHKIYSISDTVKTISHRLKRMGLTLQDLFRMTDSNYQGQINKQQFSKVIFSLRTQLQQSLFTQMFYAIDTSMNGLISQDQFTQFSIAYGGCTNTKQIRKFQRITKSKLGNLIQKKHGSIVNFLQKNPQPFSAHNFQKQLKNLGLTQNQTMLMMKTFDPSHLGQISHQLFTSLMDKVKFKSQSQQKEEEYEKSIQDLCVYWRDHKMNPITIYEQADVDGTEGVSVFELEQAFKKLIPGQTNFQIKKWVSMINLNNDSEITRDQFLNSIRSFYSLNQMSKFSDEYTKLHPELQIKDEQSIQKIMKELSQKIEDSGMSKKQTFDFIDFNKNGQLSKQEMSEGLKRLGIKAGFAGRVLSVFDRDTSEQVSLKQWLRVLGQDIQVSQVPIPDDMDEFFSESEQGQRAEMTKKKNKKQTKKQIAPRNKKQQKQIKKETNTNKTVQNKGTDKPISNNKTSKIPLKTKNEDQNKKGVLDRKFKEDQIKSKNIKQMDNNKTVKSGSKKQITKSKQVINQKAILDNSNQQQNYDNQFDDQAHNDQIQQKIAKFYKKNKSTTIKHFAQKDSKKTGKLKMRDFISLLTAFGSKCSIQITQKQSKQVFAKVCVDGEHVQYKEWLNQIADLYAQDISSVQEAKQQQKKSQPQIKQPQKQQNQAKQQQQKYSDNQFDDQQQNRQIQRAKNPGLDHNQIIKTTFNNQQKKKKRGSQIGAFTQLLSLSLTDGQKTDKGYKLIDFIDNSGNNIKKIRDNKIKNIQKLKKSGKKFVDKDFPASKNSLISDKEQSHISNITLIKWKHYSQIFKNPQLISGTIQPNDILQGGLGNCYFLCALACLSEYANIVQRLFEFVDIDIGYFLIWLCVDGEWQLVELDGYIPVGANGQPAFSRTSQDQMWVLLLQKAYAKVYGCYNHIVGGQPFQAIKDLSGAPGTNYYHDKVSINQLWDKLKQANKKQFLMSAGTPAKAGEGIKIDGRQQGVTDQGIVLGHAYSILDCQQIDKNRILQLRNPWGDMQWKGQWSDLQTQKWTSQIKKKLNHKGDENDGIFWMPLQQFFKNFVMTSINVLRPTYYYDSSIQKNIKQIAIKLKSNQFGNGCFMANRRDHRHRGESGQPYSIMSMVGFVSNKGNILHKIKQKRFMYERQGMIQFNQMTQYPQESEAVVLISLASSADLIVGYYGDKKIELEVDNNCIQYYEKLAIHDEGNQTTQTAGPLKCWLSQVQGCGFLVFKNTQNSNIILQVDIDAPKNLSLLPPSSKRNKQKIKANQVFTIRGKIIDQKQGFNFCQQIRIQTQN